MNRIAHIDRDYMSKMNRITHIDMYWVIKIFNMKAILKQVYFLLL